MSEKMAFTFATFNRYGLVIFSTEAAAADALNKVEKQKLKNDDARLEVKEAVKRTLQDQSKQNTGKIHFNDHEHKN